MQWDIQESFGFFSKEGTGYVCRSVGGPLNAVPRGSFGLGNLPLAGKRGVGGQRRVEE